MKPNKRNKAIAFLCLPFFSMLFSTGQIDSVVFDSQKAQIKQSRKSEYLSQANENDYDEIFSYRTILRDRYDEEQSLDDSLKSISFDEYIDSSTVGPQKSSSSSKDEKYILKGIDYQVLKSNHEKITFMNQDHFQRKTEYSDFSRYQVLQEGDIVLETKCNNFLLGGLLNNPGHTAYISDACAYSSYGNYVQTIEAVGGGVQYGFLDDQRMIDFGVVILRARNHGANTIQLASSFIYEQLGDPYSFSFTRANLSINDN